MKFDKRNHFSIRKLSVWVASVLLGVAFISKRSSIVAADMPTDSTTVVNTTGTPQPASSEETSKTCQRYLLAI